MKFIPETTIDQTLNSFEDEITYNAVLEDVLLNQKDLIAFIDEENQSLLTKKELSLLLYLALVIYKSVQNHHEINTIPGEDLEENEETNWEAFHDNNLKSFGKILDKLFENYPQEDLLALVEDSIQEDENEDTTQVGREIIFVAAKSIIDTLHKNIP